MKLFSGKKGMEFWQLILMVLALLIFIVVMIFAWKSGKSLNTAGNGLSDLFSFGR